MINTEKNSGTVLVGQFLLGLFLMVGILGAAWMLSTSLARLKRTTITVKGFAEKPIRSNSAKWDIRLTNTARNLPLGVAAIERDLGLVLRYLKAQNVKDESISVGGVTSHSFYRRNEKGNETNEIGGYNFEQEISIASLDVNQIARLEKESSQLLKEGILMTSTPPQYFYTQMDTIKVELLAAASKDAKQRAMTLATNSGNTVGPLVDGQQGVFQITSPNSIDTSGYGAYDTTTIDKVVKAVVTMSYVIE